MGQHLIQLLSSGQQPIPVCAVNHKDDELGSRGKLWVMIHIHSSHECVSSHFTLPWCEPHRKQTVQSQDLTALVPFESRFIQTQGGQSTTSDCVPEVMPSPGHCDSTWVSPQPCGTGTVTIPIYKLGDWRSVRWWGVSCPQPYSLRVVALELEISSHSRNETTGFCCCQSEKVRPPETKSLPHPMHHTESCQQAKKAARKYSKILTGIVLH